MLLIVCVSSSGVLALESGTQVNSISQTSGQIFDTRYTFRGNINEENFSTFQAGILNSLTKQITELQTLYSDVNQASNSSELEKVLSNHSLAQDSVWHSSMQTGSGTIYIKSGNRPGKMHVFSYNLENINEANFNETRGKMLGSLENMTQALEGEKKDFEVAGASEMVQELDGQITELQNLHTNISKASNAAELKNALTNYMQAQTIAHVENEIRSFETEMNENKNPNGDIQYSQFKDEIKDFNALIEDNDKMGSF